MGLCASTRASQYYTQILKILENSVIDNDADALDNFLRESVLTAEEIDDICLLHHASQFGFPDSIRVLLDAGANANFPDHKAGMTPLHYAVLAESGVTKCIPLLVKAGADVDSMGENCGKTPLHVAIQAKKSEAVQTLIEYGCSTNVVTECSNGISPLLEAVKQENPEILETLLVGGADIRKCWIWKTCQTPPLDTLTHMMTTDCDKEVCIRMLNTLVQADGDLVSTLCQMPKGLQTKVRAIRTYEALQYVMNRLQTNYARQAQGFIMTLVCSGYRPRGEARDYLQRYDAAIYELIQEYFRTPPSLKDLCVRKVRLAMRRNVMYGVSQCPHVTSSVKDLILIRHPPEPCLIYF